MDAEMYWRNEYTRKPALHHYPSVNTDHSAPKKKHCNLFLEVFVKPSFPNEECERNDEYKTHKPRPEAMEIFPEENPFELSEGHSLVDGFVLNLLFVEIEFS